MGTVAEDVNNINWRNLWGYKGNDRYMLALVFIAGITVLVIIVNFILDESIWSIE